ncbi:MAG: bifunctional hydroxymethylpyrimidine kinase/phosphomethylpyrimidine kinase [Kofleriaceae bacterium]
MAEAPCVLVVAGLDPSGGAGFIADVRVAERHGCRAVGAITALTEQDTVGVRAVHPVGPGELHALLTTLLTDVEVAAVKLGMLATAEHAEAVGDALALTAAPVVWDPILRPTRGQVALLDGDLRR